MNDANLNANSLYDFLYEWANRVLNINESLGFNVEIIRSNSNAPTPSSENIDIDDDDVLDNPDEANSKPDPYIVIGYTGGLRKIGRGAKPSTIDDTGLATIGNDFEKVIEIREVNGEGDLLEYLIETIDRQDILDFWHNSYVVYRGQGEIITIPSLEDNDDIKESIVEITVAFARGSTYKPGYFDDMTFSGTIPGQGSSNEITITQDT